MGDQEEKLGPPEAAQAASSRKLEDCQNFPGRGLLSNAGIPIVAFTAPSVELTETGVRYVIVTNQPNSSRMQIGLDCLRPMGCTITFDYETMENFTMVIIDAPRKLFSDQEIEEIGKK